MSNYVYAYAIKNQWINMSLYFINFMYNTKKPFGDTLVGKYFKSPIFKYGKYFWPLLVSGPLILLNPVFLVFYVVPSAASTFIADYAAQYFNIYGPNGTPDDPKQVCPYITTQERMKDNLESLGGGERNIKFLANGDFILTNFIKLDKSDILKFVGNPDNGFSYDTTQLTNSSLYMRNPWNSGNVTNQERQGDDPASNVYNNNNIYYFLKSLNNNDIILFTSFRKVI